MSIRLLTAILFFSAFVISATAQDKCPALSVNGPSGQIYPGDTAIFTINADLDLNGLKLKWTVSAGTITSGQGKPWIEVQSDPESDSPIIATVEVSGLPDGCQKFASETAGIKEPGDPPILDEYGRITLSEERSRLDDVAAEWKKNQHWYLYIILYLAPKEPRTSEQGRIKRIKDYLTRTHKIPEERLVFVSGGVFQRSTRIYGVAEAPSKQK